MVQEHGVFSASGRTQAKPKQVLKVVNSVLEKLRTIQLKHLPHKLPSPMLGLSGWPVAAARLCQINKRHDDCLVGIVGKAQTCDLPVTGLYVD